MNLHPRNIEQAQRIIYLIAGYSNGTLSTAEIAELEQWKSQAPENLTLFDELTDKQKRTAGISKWNTEESEVALAEVKKGLKRRSKLSVYWLPAAVIAVFVASFALLLRKQIFILPSFEQSKVVSDVGAGSNKAILTLANGERIDLGKAANGLLATAGKGVVKTGDSLIEYQAINKESINAVNTIETPLGGQYQLILRDGTKVWLNAGTTLQFPVAFNGTQRKVFLKGEGYFEVAKNKNKPFIVESQGQRVEVLGTHFNINTYADEPAQVTTLMEGSVKVNTSGNYAILKPGQQSLISHNQHLAVAPANLQAAMAWRNGLFEFKDAQIPVIMRQVGRWYNLEIRYNGPIPKDQFTGSIERKENLSTVLKMFELSAIKFRIEKQGTQKILIINPD
ncbi:FecR family protein [Pedobacter frigoris]|uniref:FecR family protein n=1 Tax=Pedobacter frigoris TaxID=2571272 RepID=UPI00292D84D2|nr:FecR domain-containing protein [Pedobacter frigoris]